MGRRAVPTLFVVLIVGWIMAAIWAPGPPTAQSREAEHNATKQRIVGWLCKNHGVPLPADTEVMEYEDRSGRDMEFWALLRVRPEQIGSIKSALIDYASAPNRKWTVDDSDANTVRSIGFRGQDAPTWWKPAELPDPDVIVLQRSGGIFAVLSAKTGLVYFLQWDV